MEIYRWNGIFKISHEGKGFISNIDAVIDDDVNVLFHWDDEEIQVGDKTSVAFEHFIQNVETLSSKPFPVQDHVVYNELL